MADSLQEDINFKFGQDPSIITFSFSDSEGGICWPSWQYNLYFLDTKEKVTDVGLKRNGISASFDETSLMLTIQSISVNLPKTLPLQLAVSREGYFNFTQVNFDLRLQQSVETETMGEIPFFKKLTVSQSGEVRITFSEKLLIPG